MSDDTKRAVWRVAEAARDQGWQLEMSAHGHLTLRAPHGGSLVLTAVGSAHRRTAGNVQALIGRYGHPDA